MSTSQDDTQSIQLDTVRCAAKQAREGLRAWLGLSTPETFSDESAEGLRETLNELMADLSGLNPSSMSSSQHSQVTGIIENEIGTLLETVPAMYKMLHRAPGTLPAALLNVPDEKDGPPSMAKAVTTWMKELPSFQAQASATQAATAFARGLDDDRPVWMLGLDPSGPQVPNLPAHVQPLQWSPGASFSPGAKIGQAVVLPGLLSSLPDKVLVALLREFRPFLDSDGLLVASGLRPSQDCAFTDLVLRWPTIRRTPAQLMNLLLLEGFSVSQDIPCMKPGLVVVAVANRPAVHNV